MPREKRGQVTIFIILGIILVAAVGATLYFRGGAIKNRLLGTTELSTLPEDVDALRSEIDSCQQLIATQAVELLGLQGGFIFPPQDSLTVGDSIVALAYDGRVQVPSVGSMEQDLADYMDLALPLCPEYEAYQNLQIEAGDSSTKVNTADGKVSFSTKYTLSINSGNDTFRVSEPYSSTVETDLVKMRETMLNVANTFSKQPGTIDPAALLSLGMPIQIFPIDGETALFIIEDASSQLRTGGPFTYIFGTRK